MKTCLDKKLTFLSGRVRVIIFSSVKVKEGIFFLWFQKFSNPNSTYVFFNVFHHNMKESESLKIKRYCFFIMAPVATATCNDFFAVNILLASHWNTLWTAASHLEKIVDERNVRRSGWIHAQLQTPWHNLKVNFLPSRVKKEFSFSFWSYISKLRVIIFWKMN